MRDSARSTWFALTRISSRTRQEMNASLARSLSISSNARHNSGIFLCWCETSSERSVPNRAISLPRTLPELVSPEQCDVSFRSAYAYCNDALVTSKFIPRHRLAIVHVKRSWYSTLACITRTSHSDYAALSGLLFVAFCRFLIERLHLRPPLSIFACCTTLLFCAFLHSTVLSSIACPAAALCRCPLPQPLSPHPQVSVLHGRQQRATWTTPQPTLGRTPTSSALEQHVDSSRCTVSYISACESEHVHILANTEHGDGRGKSC